MAYIKADTNKLIQNGEDIIKLADEYSTLYEELYAKLSILSKKGWVSSNAIDYVNKVNLEKKNHEEVMKDIKKYGNYFINSATELDSMIKKWS